MTQAIVFVDFQNIAEDGRVRLNCAGTLEDLQRLGIHLEEGLVLHVADGDLFATIVVRAAGEDEWRGEFIEGPIDRSD